MLTAKTTICLDPFSRQQEAVSAPQSPAEISAWFSVSDAGVIVEPLVMMTLAPGTRGERSAVGIVEQRNRPTPVSLPGGAAMTLSAGGGTLASDEVVTGSRVACAPSTTAASRYGEKAGARYGVAAPEAADGELRFPMLPPAGADEWTKERVWRRVAMRLESLLEVGGSDPARR